MKVDGSPYRTIWLKSDDPTVVCAIDQRALPHHFEVATIKTVAQMADAIKEMLVRGAPLIGVAAAYGLYLAALEAPADDFDNFMAEAAELLLASRPTAVNLQWAVREQGKVLAAGRDGAAERLRRNAQAIADADVAACRAIGDYGLEVIRAIAQRKDGRTLNVLTHCNAGWLCAVDWGTATAPIYRAFDEGIDIHVWVDETRPRNQGASLTAWELGQHGVPYTLITDNAGGHLMQTGKVDLVITGTDRVTRGGDVANKIGTYLKALAAHANGIPFYVAAPGSSIDWGLIDGKDIPIEERSADEVKYVQGLTDDGKVGRVLISPENARVSNYGFDVTPRQLITGLITEKGICGASEKEIAGLFGRDEGVIKFQCRMHQGELTVGKSLGGLIQHRDQLRAMNLVGVYPDGVGFGNVSVRVKQGFLITASQTGHVERTGAEHYCLVTAYSINENWVECVGELKASSESLTHAMVYEVFPQAGAVVHVHNNHHWRHLLLGRVPATSADVKYGTPEMAAEIARLANDTDLADVKVLVMAGHEDGILSFGRDLMDAVEALKAVLELDRVSSG